LSSKRAEEVEGGYAVGYIHNANVMAELLAVLNKVL
jgi:hypothetical protein